MISPRFYSPTILDQTFGLCIDPQDVLFPVHNVHSGNYYRPWKWSTQRVAQDFGSTIQYENENYKICLDVQHFKPDEINVKVADNAIIIEANHEEREDEHGLISRYFKRRYFLPNDCAADSVVSTLSSDGILIVTADRKKHITKEIIVPITICNTSPPVEVKTYEEKGPQKTSESMKVNNTANLCTTIILKEDHSRLLKPELLGKVAVNIEKAIDKRLEGTSVSQQSFNSMTESRLSESTISESGAGSSGISTAATENIIDNKTSETKESKHSDTVVDVGCMKSDQIECQELGVSLSGSGVESSCSKLEVSCMKSTATESSQQSTSYSSAMSSSLKQRSERISEIVSDISAQLKEAADNI